jgi:hypothetical protein
MPSIEMTIFEVEKINISYYLHGISGIQVRIGVAMSTFCSMIRAIKFHKHTQESSVVIELPIRPNIGVNVNKVKRNVPLLALLYPTAL